MKTPDAHSLPVLLIRLFTAFFSFFWAVAGMAATANCSGISAGSCNLTNQRSVYTEIQKLNNTLDDGTIIGSNTVSYDYVCNVLGSSDRYLILGLTTETSSIGNNQFKTTTDGVVFQVPARGQLGGVYDRINLEVVGSRTNGGNECLAGHSSVMIGNYVKQGKVTAQNGLAYLDFSPAANYVSARYNTGPGYVYIMDPFRAPTPISVGETTCTLNGGVKNVDLGKLSSSQFAGVNYGSTPKNYTPVSFTLDFNCETTDAFTADITLDGVADENYGFATDNDGVSIIIKNSKGEVYTPGQKGDSVSITESGSSAASAHLTAYPTPRTGATPPAGIFSANVTIYLTYE